MAYRPVMGNDSMRMITNRDKEDLSISTGKAFVLCGEKKDDPGVVDERPGTRSPWSSREFLTHS